jgi:DNA-binding NarL/FixJ family response regulator
VCGEAVDGFDALEKTRYLSPDLIVLDLEMPRMCGLHTARELRAMKIRAPIIIFTMYADAVLLQNTLAVEISAVISKTDTTALLQQDGELAHERQLRHATSHR